MLPLLLALSTHAAEPAPTCERLVAALDAQLAGAHRCAHGALAGAREAAARAGLTTCLDAALHARKLPATPRLPVPPPVVRLDGDTDAEADTDPPGIATRRAAGLDVPPNLFESEHFAIRWGSDAVGFDSGDVRDLAEWFEASLRFEVDTLGFPAPRGTDAWRMNIFLGDTGPETPSAYQAAGYATVDEDNFPYIVLAGAYIGNPSLHSTIPHELFHTIQETMGGYDYDQLAGWYFEATAVWVEAQILPDDPSYATSFFGWSLYPDYPVNYFDYYEGSGSFLEYHQYAAGVFVQHLTTTVSDVSLVQRSWTPPHSDDPLATLDTLLFVEGTSARDVYADFAARAATWDFPNGALYRDTTSAYESFATPPASRVTGSLSFVDDVVRSRDRGPTTYGTNYWRLGSFLPDEVTIELDGDPDTQWVVTGSLRTDDAHTRSSTVIAEGGVGTLDLSGVTDASEAWVTVSAFRGTVPSTQRFRYTLTVDGEALDATPDDEPEKRKCGCDGGAGGPAGVIGLAGALLLRRRALSGPRPS